MNNLEDYTKIPWPQGLITETVTEDKVWGSLLYQSHRDKRKKGIILKAGKTRIIMSNSDTKDCAALLSRSLTGGTIKLVENHDRSQFLGYFKLIQ